MHGKRLDDLSFRIPQHNYDLALRRVSTRFLLEGKARSTQNFHKSSIEALKLACLHTSLLYRPGAVIIIYGRVNQDYMLTLAAEEEHFREPFFFPA